MWNHRYDICSTGGDVAGSQRVILCNFGHGVKFAVAEKQLREPICFWNLDSFSLFDAFYLILRVVAHALFAFACIYTVHVSCLLYSELENFIITEIKCAIYNKLLQ